MPKPNHGERLAAVEIELKGLRADVGEMKRDVKSLLAAHERQKGAARLAAVIWAGLLAACGVAAGAWFEGRRHP